jgi:hypothetical protein
LYRLIKLEINNLLCFGGDNIVEFSNIKGINIIESSPANTGGKCIRYDTKVTIKYDPVEIIKKIGFLPKELE